MVQRLSQTRLFQRLSDIFIPFLSWFIITMPIWLSFFHPAIVAYFILAFDLYFFYKSINTTYLAVTSYMQIVNYSKINFAVRVKKVNKALDIHHFIIIPNFSEPVYKIESTLRSIINTDYPFPNIYLVLAFEEREAEVHDKAQTLINKYKEYFKDIICTYHPLNSQEVPGKASNQTFAARVLDPYLTQRNISPQNALITICDADSHLPKNYFSYLTYEYLNDQGHQYHFYWAPVLLYNNFNQLPLFIRIQATLSSIVRLAFLNQKEQLIHTSTYSTNFWLLKAIGYWDVDIIPEDWHVYFQAFFTFGEKVKTLPLFTIINGDAVYSGGLIKTLINRYEQEKRWAWGASDIGYTIKKFFTTPHLNPIVKLRKIFFLAETHLMWPTSFFILTVSASVPPLINPLFKRTVLGFLLPRLSGLILTLASLLLIFYIYLDVKLRQKLNLKTRMRSIPLLIAQWYLLPIVSFLLSSLPALEAHTRLLLGKKIKYKVTEKV